MEIKKILQEKKVRITPIRKAVLEILHTSNYPLGIQEIFETCVKSQIRCDLVTIYRTIELFLDQTIVKKIDFQDGKMRYEIEGEHHHHLICDACGAIQAVHDICLTIREPQVMETHGFQIHRHQLEFFGLCKQCRNQKK